MMDNDKFGDNNNSHVDISQNQNRSKNNDQKEMIKTSMSTSGSVKLKKSSNLLAAFVRRRKNKARLKGDSELTTVKEPSPNVSFIASSTTLGMRSEDESMVNLENYEDYDAVVVSQGPHKYSGSEPTIAQASSRPSFFRKLMKKPGASLEHNKCSRKTVHIGTSQTEACQIGDSGPSSDTTEMNKISSEELNALVPTCFVNFGKPTLNLTLATGLQLVQELASRLLESENHFMQIFSRYINDPVCQKELLSTLSQHSKLQWETERRTNSLANDMWLHQIEIGRAQERTLQETLNSLVKQNRQLQIDNEMLFRRNERLINKMQACTDSGLSHRCVDCDNRFEFFVKRNEKLQYKLSAFCQQIQYLENELHILQKNNDGLEQQLRSCSHQIHNIKAIYQRSKMDYELEIVALNHKIMKHESSIKDAVEAGDVLFEDLESVNKQIQNIAIPINLNNLKCHRGGIIDLVHFCRLYVNEMAKEIITMFTQVRSQEKDIHNLEETNAKLLDNLKTTKSELTCLTKKIQENSVKETEIIILEQKCKLQETDAQILKEQMTRQKEKYDLEIKTLLEKLENIESTNKAISEKDKVIDQTKLFVNNITSENVTLRSQVESLNKVLAVSGAGDVLQELSHVQEQLAFFQAQYYQLLNEKQVLSEQIDLLRNDNKRIVDLQEANHKKFQKQLDDLELIGKENSELKQQLEAEHQTVLSLQADRLKHLEEKSIFKSIFQHMKSEITKVQKLEGTVTDISKEANKLAMIAEYNKNLGEKLKSEVTERDRTILQLRTSVDKLNEVQIKNTKEKLALCYELSELSQEKEKLSDILNIEVKKNMVLDDSKKEIVKTASTQLRKFEEIQKSERSALTDLVKDFKVLCAERDQLQNDKDKLLQEVAELKSVNNERVRQVDSLMFSKNDADIKLKEALSKIEIHEASIAKLNASMTSEVKKYHNNVKQLEKLIIQLRIDKEKLDEVVKYLQNNTEKLHRELNTSRKNESEISSKLNKITLEKELLLKEREDIIRAYDEEKDKLQGEIHNVNCVCEKILADYESAMKASVEKEEVFKSELDESKKLLLNNAKEIEHLNEMLSMKQEEIFRMSDDYCRVKEKEKRCDEALKSVDEYKREYEDLIDRKFMLEKEICNIQANFRNTKEDLEKSKQEVENLQQKLAKAVEEKEKQTIAYKKHAEELTKKHTDVLEKCNVQVRDLKVQIQDLAQQLNNERSAYASLSQIHKEISAKFLKGIKDLVDEKNSKQEAISKLRDLTEYVATLKAEKEDLQQQVNLLLDGLNDGKNRINFLNQEKETEKSAFEDLQKRYNELLQKCISLENQVREPNLNEKDLEASKNQIEKLQKELEDNNNTMLILQRDFTNLQKQVTSLEFQKSEATLRFHETQRKLQTEQSLCELLKNTHKIILDSILKLKEDGKMDPVDCNHIVHMVQSNSSNSTGLNEMKST